MNMGFLLLAFNRDLKQHGDADTLHQRRNYHDPHRVVAGPGGVQPARAGPPRPAPEALIFARRARHSKSWPGEHPTHNAKVADDSAGAMRGQDNPTGSLLLIEQQCCCF